MENDICIDIIVSISPMVGIEECSVDFFRGICIHVMDFLRKPCDIRSCQQIFCLFSLF